MFRPEQDAKRLRVTNVIVPSAHRGTVRHRGDTDNRILSQHANSWTQLEVETLFSRIGWDFCVHFAAGTHTGSPLLHAISGRGAEGGPVL